MQSATTWSDLRSRLISKHSQYYTVCNKVLISSSSQCTYLCDCNSKLLSPNQALVWESPETETRRVADPVHVPEDDQPLSQKTTPEQNTITMETTHKPPETWNHWWKNAILMNQIVSYLSWNSTTNNRCSSTSGASNLFDRRANCTNFKLVRGQTTKAPKVPRSRCWRRRGGGNGEGVSTSPAD